MQNIINFDVRGDYVCSCVANIFNGAETINLFFEADEYIAPQLEISIIGETTTTTVYDLEVVNGYAVYNLDHTIFTKKEQLTIKYIDGTKSGTTFYFNKIRETYSSVYTLRVDKISTDTFKMNFVAKRKLESSDFSPEDFSVNEDGEIVVKSPKKIDVTKENGVIAKITLTYGAESESTSTDIKTYNCSWDNNGNLIKFGDLPITWSG